MALLDLPTKLPEKKKYVKELKAKYSSMSLRAIGKLFDVSHITINKCLDEE